MASSRSKRALPIILFIALGLAFRNPDSLAFGISEGLFRQEEKLLLLEEEFVITPTKQSRPARKAPSIVTTITAKQIEQMGARNLMDALRIVPGLNIYIARYGQGEIAVRGIRTSGSEKIRVMIDGHCINEYFMGSAMSINDDLELDNVKRIEVIRGPGSALYGENAFVAVINIITKDAQDIDGTVIKTGRGSFNTDKYNITFGKKTDKLEMVGSMTHLKTNGPSLWVESDALTNSGRTKLWKDKDDFNLKLSCTDLVRNDDKLMFNTKYTEKKRSDYLGLIGALNDETSMDLQQFFGELSYRHPVGKKATVTYKTYYDQFKEDIVFEIVPDSLYIAPSVTNHAIGLEGELDYEMSSNNLLVAGFMLQTRKQYGVKYKTGSSVHSLTTDTKNWNNDGYRRDIWAIYLQDEWDFRDVNLTMGARYDRYSDFGGAFNPRLGLAWQLARDTSLKILHGWAFRVPNMREMFDRNNTNTAGTEDLDPEKIKTTEVALICRFTPKIEGGITYFYNNIRKWIVEDPNAAGSPTLFTFRNKDGADIQGVELELKGILTPNIHAWTNYSYQRARDKATGYRLPDVPVQKFTAGINMDLNKYLNANTYLLSESKFPRANSDQRSDLPGYAIVNITLIAKEFFQTIEIRGSIYNLLDKDYKYSSPLNKTSGTGLVPSDYPQVGRNYMLEASYKF